MACNVSIFCWLLFLLLFWNLCRCGIQPYAALGDASQCPLQPAGQPDRCQPQAQCFRNCPMIVMTARARARARSRGMETTRAKTRSPRLAREKRFFPEQQQKILQVLLLSLGLGILALLAGALTSWQWFSVLASECSAASASVNFMLFKYFAQDFFLEFCSSSFIQHIIFNWLKN